MTTERLSRPPRDATRASLPWRSRPGRRPVGLQILIGFALLAVGCGSAIPSPSAVSPQPTATGVAPRPAPEDCEDFDIVPCPRQVARL